MLTASSLSQIAQEMQAPLLREIERQSRASLFRAGQWVLYYRCLRVLAHKPKPDSRHAQEALLRRSCGCLQTVITSRVAPLQPCFFMLPFLLVPPSMRQAAGPLIENLPHVCLGDRIPVDLSLDRPSPRGTQRRLSSPGLPLAPLVSRALGKMEHSTWRDLFQGQPRSG